jgi:hypothetical protein
VKGAFNALNLGPRVVVPCTAMKLSPQHFSFALLTFLWLSSSGCGLEYGKDGFIERAVAADAREQVRGGNVSRGAGMA